MSGTHGKIRVRASSGTHRLLMGRNYHCRKRRRFLKSQYGGIRRHARLVGKLKGDAYIFSRGCVKAHFLNNFLTSQRVSFNDY
jgi:hypothetical protein